MAVSGRRAVEPYEVFPLVEILFDPYASHGTPDRDHLEVSAVTVPEGVTRGTGGGNVAK